MVGRPHITVEYINQVYQSNRGLTSIRERSHISGQYRHQLCQRKGATSVLGKWDINYIRGWIHSVTPSISEKNDINCIYFKKTVLFLAMIILH